MHRAFRNLPLSAAALGVVLAVIAASAPATASTPAARLAPTRLGPLKLGMTRAAALRTGWLSHPSRGCELASPVPTDFSLTGSRAPKGLAGVAEFSRGRLQAIELTRGATTLGAVVGRTTPRQMVRTYRRHGFAASSRFDNTFRVTFVTVSRRGHQVLGAAARKGKLISVAAPFPLTCD